MHRIVRHGLTELDSPRSSATESTLSLVGHNRCSKHLMITMHDLQIKMHQVSGVEVVEMTGAIDALAFADLSATLGRMIAEVTPCIVLECSRVTYIGSAQLKELLDFAHMAQARGGDLKCVGIAPTIQHVANLIAMGDLMEFFDDLPQAVRSFRGLPAAVLH
jgi:anti-anti-sigma factor